MEDQFTSPIEYQSLSTDLNGSFLASANSCEADLIEFWKRNNLPTFLPKGAFFWQYRINLSTYEGIKKRLIALEFAKNTKLINRYAFHIAFYLSEWFKREYDGYLCERGLDQLGLTSVKSKQIWEHAQIDESYLINSSQNEWLFSMYVLGGFPVKYVCRVKRFDALFKDIWNIRQGDEIDEETVNGISSSFDSNNTVYQISLRPGGSLFEYINRIIEEDYPLSDDDKKIEPYSHYCELLNEGKRYCFDNFFSHEFKFYTDGESEGIDTEIHVQVGFKKNRCYIPVDCVKTWNVTGDCNDLTDFVLGLQANTGEKSRNQIRFSKTGNGKAPYVGWGTSSSFHMNIDISQTKEIHVKLYSIEDISLEKGKIIKTIKIANHYQVYQTNNPFCWSNKVNNQTASALLFSPQKYKTVDAESESKELIPLYGDSINWCWIRIIDSVTLRDNSGSEFTFSAYKGSLGVRFKTKSDIRFNEAKEVEYTYFDGEEEKTCSLPIMFGPDGIRTVKFYPFEREKKTQTLNRNQYRIEYKQEEQTFQTLDKHHKPKCGVVRLRITDESGLHAKTIRCFYLPTDVVFERDLQERTIKFLSCSIPVWHIDDEGQFILNEEPCLFDDTNYNQEEDYVPFRIGTKDAYITIYIARANDCKEVYFNNRYLTTLNSNQSVQIPLILKDYFSIRKINKEGVIRSEVGKDRILDYQFMDNYNNNQTIEQYDYKLGVKYYLYRDMCKERGEDLILDISSKHYSNYVFYYWSLQNEEQPIRIKSYYDEEKQALIVSTAVLRRRLGIVFQSLKTTLPPNYIYPVYAKREKLSVLTEKSYSSQIYKRCFEIASEHNVYFSQFPPFFISFNKSNRIDNRVDLITMALDLLRNNSNNKRKVIQDLHRFASEFAFDWFLLPWLMWKKNCKSVLDRNNVEQLFRLNPHIKSQSERTYLDMILKMYWRLPNSKEWKFGRKDINKYIDKLQTKGVLENIALQAIRGKNNDFFLLKNKTNQGTESYEFQFVSNFLLEYWSSERIYCDIYNLINDKINL